MTVLEGKVRRRQSRPCRSPWSLTTLQSCTYRAPAGLSDHRADSGSPCVEVQPAPSKRYGTKSGGIDLPLKHRRITTSSVSLLSISTPSPQSLNRLGCSKQTSTFAGHTQCTSPASFRLLHLCTNDTARLSKFHEHSHFVVLNLMRKHVEECIRLVRYSVRVFLQRQVLLAVTHVSVDKHPDARVQQVRRQVRIRRHVRMGLRGHMFTCHG